MDCDIPSDGSKRFEMAEQLNDIMIAMVDESKVYIFPDTYEGRAVKGKFGLLKNNIQSHEDWKLSAAYYGEDSYRNHIVSCRRSIKEFIECLEKMP